MGAPSDELAGMHGASIEKHTGRVQYVAADVSQTVAAIEPHWSLRRAQRFGTVDVLFNNAAIFDMAPLLEVGRGACTDSASSTST